MTIIFHLLLMLTVARCTEHQVYETKTVHTGDDVNLICSRKVAGSLFWIRLVPNDVPEILARSYSLDNKYSHMTARREAGTFVLHIARAKLSDAAIYICLKTYQQNVWFLTEIDLRVEESAYAAVAPVRPRDSVTLQCSVSASGTKTFPEGNSVCCFRAQPHQSFNCTQGNTSGVHVTDLDGLSANECVFGFFKNISSSAGGSHYCAVATCEDKDSENGSELNNEVNAQNPEKAETAVFLLSAALAVSLLVIVFLVYSGKKHQNKLCDCCKAPLMLQPAIGNQENQQTDEDSLVYSVANFTSRKSSKAERKETKPSEDESVYTDVRALGSGSFSG